MTFRFEDWQSGNVPPKGWDVADAVSDGWTKQDIDNFMRATVRSFVPAPVDPGTQPGSAPGNPGSDDENRPREPAPPGRAGRGKSTATAQAKTTQQEKPETATVTSIKTRRVVSNNELWQDEILTNEDTGKMVSGAQRNWGLFLENHRDMRGVFAFDAFKMTIMLMRAPPWEDAGEEWKPRQLIETDYANAAMWLETFHMTPKASNIHPVILSVAERNKFDRLEEYLSGLEWDGIPRISNWMVRYLGTDDTKYASIIGRRFLISAVARGLDPGCKVDTMPILEGPQGARKSSVLRELFGDEFFTDELSDIASKDASMEMQGVWGIEIAEMHRFSASETNAVKKFLTRQVDRYRPPYGRSVIEVKRRSIMAGTINPEGSPYLKDPTGARRFWPITVGSIDLEALKRDRDQLWAEAIHEYKSGTQHWIQSDELQEVEEQQSLRTDVDVWTDAVAATLKTRTEVTMLEVLKEIGMATKDADQRHGARVGRIMKKLGWEMKRDRTASGDKIKFVNSTVLPGVSGVENDW